MTIFRIGYVLMLLFPSLTAWSGVEEELWKKAVTEAEAGQYEQAIADFTRLAENGLLVPELYQNLAACYQRSGQSGRAIACLEFALRQHPAEGEAVVAMLSGLLRALDRQLPRPSAGGWREALFFWVDRVSPTLLVGGFLGLWFMGWGTLALRMKYPRKGISVVGSSMLMLAMYAGIAWWEKTHPVPIGVAVQAEVPVFFGKNADDVPRFTLLEGDRVAVTAMEDSWLKIYTADGKTGWTRTGGMALVAGELKFPPDKNPLTTESGV